MGRPLVLLLTAVLFFSSTPAWAQKTDEERIISIIRSAFKGADERDWEKIESLLANKVLLDYTSMGGGKPSIVTPREITASWKGLLPGFRSTHHQIGRFSVRVKGREAAAFFHGLALHYLPNREGGDSWVVSGTYDYRLLKHPVKGWVVDKIKFNLLRQCGNINLPKLAVRNVKGGVTFLPVATGRETLAAVDEFFTSLESMDIERFMKTWAGEARQVMPLSPKGFPVLLRGKDAVHRQYRGLPVNFSSMKFPRKVYATDDPNRMIVQYDGVIQLRAGGEYNNIYVGVFDVRNGKIRQLTEYFDPDILLKTFGGEPGKKFGSAGGRPAERKVEFYSGGVKLAGRLHLPENFSEKKKYRGVVVTGSWTTVKEQMAGLYAGKLTAGGFVTMSFDFRNFGESRGVPRDYEVPSMKAEDIVSAVKYLGTLSFIERDNISALAVCASAGYLAEALRRGAPVRRAVFVAPWLHNPEIVVKVYGGEKGVAGLKAMGDRSMKEYREHNMVKYVPAASRTDKNAVMYGSYDYYLNPQRGAVPQWGNRFALMAWRGWLEFDPVSLAGSIRTPLLIIHSRKAAIPEGTEKFFKGLKGEKQIIWIDKADQFDFYDREPYTTARIE